MKTNVVLRNVRSSKQLVDFSRDCCSQLATHVRPSERCDVLLQAIHRGGDIIACVVVGDDEPLAVQCADTDPFTAVRRAVADMLACLELERPKSPAGDVASPSCEAEGDAARVGLTG